MNNQRRFLAEVLTIDAWHDPIDAGNSTTKVHVELSFKRGRLGGGDHEFPFTFNLALKRAVLTVKLEQPLELDRNTVARQIPSTQAELTRITAARQTAKSSVGISGKVNPAAMVAALGAEFSRKGEHSKEDELRLIQQTPRIIAVPRPYGAHEYAWELIPGFEETLEGQPWNPVDEPRFALKNKNLDSRLERVIKVFVSCKVADIEISDLQLKKDSTAEKLKELAFNRMNEAAAIQHLKLTLRDMNLVAGSTDDRFAELVIADILSVQS